MQDDPNEGQPAFEQTSLSDIHGPERKPIDELIPGAAVSSAADEGTPPADPSRVSPADPAGGEPPAEPEKKPDEPETQPDPAAAGEDVPVVQLSQEEFAQAIGQAVQQVLTHQEEQRQVTEAQRNQPKPPDWDIDPAGAAAYHDRKAEEARMNERVGMSTEFMRQMVPDFDEVMGGPEQRHLSAYVKANPHMAPALQTMLRTSAHPAKAAYDFLKRERELQAIQQAGGMDAFRKQAVDEFFTAYAQPAQPAAQPGAQPAQAQQPAQAAPNSPQAEQPAPTAADDPNAPAFPSPAIPKMMGDDRSSPPGGDGFKGDISLEALDRERPGGKLRRVV